MSRLAKNLRVPTPADRGPWQAWRPGTPPPIPADTPSADIRVGYARCSRPIVAMAETDRETIRESTLEGLNATVCKGNHGGRPPVITDDMLLASNATELYLIQVVQILRTTISPTATHH